LRACPRKYGEKGTLVTTRLQQTRKTKRKIVEVGESSQQGRERGFARECSTARTKRKAGVLGESSQRGREEGIVGIGSEEDEEVQCMGTVDRWDEPKLATKLGQWRLVESVKRGDGNCFFYSIGEALGLFHGLENLGVRTKLRKEVTSVLVEGSGPEEWGSIEGPYREMIKGKATEAADLEILQRSEQEWVSHWIWKRCTMEGGRHGMAGKGEP
jgi:hypothetical protein